MINIENVSKKYGHFKALSGVNLEIKEGEAVALLGPNGAGKSTILKCLLGLLDFEGEIFINDINLKENSKLVKSTVAYVPQEPSFYDMRVIDILEFYASLRRVEFSKIKKVLDIVDLTEHQLKFTTELSGGMKQKLSFSVALMADTPILLLDEPTSNLDKSSRKEILDITKKLKESEKTIVFTSHRIDEVFYIADRIIFLDSGRVIRQELTNNLKNNGFRKTKLELVISKNYFMKSKEILINNGYEIIDSNEQTLTLKIDHLEKMNPIRTLLESKIDILDFNIEAQDTYLS